MGVRYFLNAISLISPITLTAIPCVACSRFGMRYVVIGQTALRPIIASKLKYLRVLHTAVVRYAPGSRRQLRAESVFGSEVKLDD